MRFTISILLGVFTIVLPKATNGQCPLPPELVFATQADIDNFPVMYPDCTVIPDGVNVSIIGPDIVDLTPLSQITSILGAFEIRDCPVLTNLTGLDNLKTVGNDPLDGLILRDLSLLSTLSSLNNLTTITGEFTVRVCNSLVTLTGLEKIDTVNGSLIIRDNALLQDFEGLNAIVYIGETLEILNNPVLTDISALSNVNTIVGGPEGGIFISGNAALTNLTGLGNCTTTVGSNLDISLNGNLFLCAVPSICNYLADPPAGAVITISANSVGCASIAEVKDACDTLFVTASVKVFLQGPYVPAAQLMHDSLRVKNLIPLTEPYTGLTNFTHVGGGGEQTTAAVLSVTGPDAIVDWVFLELRDTANPALVLATRSALLQRDGDVVDVNGVSPVAFGIPAGKSYFVTARHRNHLGVQTGEAVFYSFCEALATDFRSPLPGGFYAFNGLNPAQKTIGAAFALWAGNGRIDYQLKYNGSVNDRNAVLSAVGLTTPNAIVPGYRVEDYNMDGVVKYNGSANDRNVLLGNVGIATPLAVVWDQVAR